MKSTVLKILKTIMSVSAAFVGFTFIVIIAFYFSNGFRLDEGLKTFLLENDPDLEYINAIN